MGRIGRLMMLFGFLAIWLVPVFGAVIMVTGAVTAAIDAERMMAPGEVDQAAGESPDGAAQPDGRPRLRAIA
jgi:hypothetical protein